MILHDLIQTNEWLSIELTMQSLYPDYQGDMESYRKVFEMLRERTPAKSDIEITLTQCYDDETGDESHVDVSGRDPNAAKDELTEWLAIEFTPWNEWLGMTISKETLADFNELEIICHCLFEMTFVSFDEQEILDYLESIKKTAEEYKSLSPEEKKARTRSLDDLMNRPGDE